MHSFSWKVLFKTVIFKTNLSTPVTNSFYYSSTVYFFQSLYCLQDVCCYYFPILWSVYHWFRWIVVFISPFFVFPKSFIGFNSSLWAWNKKNLTIILCKKLSKVFVIIVNSFQPLHYSYWRKEMYLRCGSVPGSAFGYSLIKNLFFTGIMTY